MTLISIRTCRLLFGAAAGALLLSCEPEVSVTEWTPVAYSEILGEMDNLSGRLLSDDPSETAAFLDEQAAEAGGLEQTSTFLRDLYRQVEPILSALESSEGGVVYTDEVVENGAHGTTVYARISCFGANADTPTSDFSDGELYLEGPTFSLESLLESPLAVDGNVLGEFRDNCVLGQTTVSGEFPAYFSDLADHLMMDLDVTVTADNQTARRVRFPILILRNAVRILLSTADRGSYMVEIAADGGAAFALGTAEGRFSCTIGGERGFDCAAELEE